MKMGRKTEKINKKEHGRDGIPAPVLSGLLAFAAVLTLPQMLNLHGNPLAVGNSWFGVPVYGILWVSCYRAVTGIRQAGGGDGGHGMAAAGVTACVFAVCLAFGVQLESRESVDFLSGVLWFAVLAWSLVFFLWIYYGWMLLERRGDAGAGSGGMAEEAEKPENAEKQGKAGMAKEDAGWMARLRIIVGKWDGLSGKKRAAATVCFFLLSWLPVFLAVYPGFFVYDAQEELVQVQTRQFTTHHPLPHVLLLGGTIQAVHKLTGSYNAGIAAYTLLQMAGMAAVFAYVLSYMKKSGVRRWLRTVTAFYFGFFPVNVMFVLCSAKDGIFSAALLLLLTALADFAKDAETFLKSRGNLLRLAGSALVMMCFRHNGMYAFLALAPVLLFAFAKGCRRKTALLLGTVFAAYALVTTGLEAALDAKGAGRQEMLTVPIQQLARVWKYEGDSLTEEQKETLYGILPEEALPYYTAKVSDGVKIWFDNEAFTAEPSKYIRLWAEIGLRHPFTYLNAWFMTSYGFWYPDTVFVVYRGNSVFTFTYADSSFFGYEVEQPGERHSLLPWLDGWYRDMSLEIAQQKVPVVSMLFSMGFLFWVFAFACGYAYYRKKYSLLLPFAMLGFLWLTVILGPTYLPRYVLVLWFALPWAAAVLVNGV